MLGRRRRISRRNHRAPGRQNHQIKRQYSAPASFWAITTAKSFQLEFPTTSGRPHLILNLHDLDHITAMEGWHRTKEPFSSQPRTGGAYPVTNEQNRYMATWPVRVSIPRRAAQSPEGGRFYQGQDPASPPHSWPRDCQIIPKTETPPLLASIISRSALCVLLTLSLLERPSCHHWVLKGFQGVRHLYTKEGCGLHHGVTPNHNSSGGPTSVRPWKAFPRDTLISPLPSGYDRRRPSSGFALALS